MSLVSIFYEPLFSPRTLFTPTPPAPPSSHASVFFFSISAKKKTASKIAKTPISQTHLGQIYQNDYFKDELFKAAAQVQACAEAAGLNGHAVALRWILHHSLLSPKYGDGIILGASSVAQLQQNLDVVEQGPLSTELAEKLDKVWEVAKEVAPAYHM